MKKGILIAAFFLIGIVGLFRQITAPKITFDDVFSTNDEEKKTISEQPQKPIEEVGQGEVGNMSEEGLPYDQRGQELPLEAAETDREYYTDGINIQVFFSDADKSSLSGILPAEAMENLNYDLQMFLNEKGYTDARELAVTGLEEILGQPGFTFQSGVYPVIFRAYWDGENMQFEVED